MRTSLTTWTVLSAGLVLMIAGCGGSSSNEAEAVENDSIWQAAADGRVEAVRQSIAAGADINGTFVLEGVPGSGGSPLHLAALAGQADMVDWLIGVGANLDVRADDEYGGTPLHWAAAFGEAEVAEMLIDAGANVNAGDNTGYTPLDAAMLGLSGDAEATGRVQRVLISNGAVTRDG
ncbi:MAG: ankyrin repeat domain-containing protein [Planctomycetota bacterium]